MVVCGGKLSYSSVVGQFVLFWIQIGSFRALFVSPFIQVEIRSNVRKTEDGSQILGPVQKSAGRDF